MKDYFAFCFEQKYFFHKRFYLKICCFNMGMQMKKLYQSILVDKIRYFISSIKHRLFAKLFVDITIILTYILNVVLIYN